ncbi:MAG: Holliday junction helicase RuvA [Chitinophagaceae bacterium]|nr:Holliday junction helicase RuvA [Chitinophagaceae bacterium]
MIAFLRGPFTFKSPAQVIVDVNGVGYELNISLNTYSSIQGKATGQLFTYLHITENNQTLYGFAEQSEKELFLQLISVSGVGAATARMMLSGMKPEEIGRAIIQGNAKQLEGIKGIGRKTAERLIVELRDKLAKQPMDNLSTHTSANSVEQDALYALISLGIPKPAAEQAIKKIQIQNGENISAEILIKQVLKSL